MPKKEKDGDNDQDDEDNFVYARVPKNLLKKLALLSVKLKMSVRQSHLHHSCLQALWY
jgi:hypothetical protein